MSDQSLKVLIVACGVFVAVGLVVIAVLAVLVIKARRERNEIEDSDPIPNDSNFNFAEYNKMRKISKIMKCSSVFLGGILIILTMLAVLTGCIYGVLSNSNSAFFTEQEQKEEIVYRIHDLSAVVVVEDYEDLRTELNVILDDLRASLFVLVSLSILDYICIRIMLRISGKYDKRIKNNLNKND